MGLLSDYLFGKIIQRLEERVKENPMYQKITGHISIIASHNSELNQLIEESIKIAKGNSIVADLQDEEIKRSIDRNIDVISDCIIISEENFSLSSFLLRISYISDNEENRKKVETFYKSLYRQLYDKKQNFPTLQNIEIQSKLEIIEEEIKTGFNKNYELLQSSNKLLQEMALKMPLIQNDEIIYNNELNEIENEIKNRQFITARSMALNLREKIVKNNKREEIEKLYGIIINTYLLQGEKTEEALDYFDNLILYTKDEKKKKARNILRQILKRDFQNAQAELDNIFQKWDSEEIEHAFYENQINLYFITHNFNTAYDFIIKNTDRIKKYQYFLAITFIQQEKFDDAMNLVKENIDFFNESDFDIQRTKIEIHSHYLLRKARISMTFEIINALKELSNEIKKLITIAGDCKTIISYLHSINAIILAAIIEKELSKIEYEKALELDPDNYNVLKNYPYLLLDNPENMAKGLELIKKYLQKYPDVLDDKLLYYSILTMINPEQVIKDISEQKDVRIELKVYLVHALDRTYQYTKAESLLNELFEKNADCFSVLFCAGCHYANINKHHQALETFLKAYSLCRNENDYESVFYYLLRIVCSQHHIEKMIIIKNLLETRYDRALILFKYPHYYIHILLVLGEYKTCISCCDELRKNGINEEYIANAEFTCYYNTKNFQKVKQVLIDNRFNYSYEILIRMACACVSIGEYNLTKEILKIIKKPENKGEYIILARLQFSIKEFQESLRTIHCAYNKYPNDREVQEFFIKLVFGYHIQIESDDIAASFNECLQLYRVADYANKIIYEVSIPKNATGDDILKLISEQLPKNSDINRRIEQIRINRLPISFFRLIFNKSLFSIHDMVINSKDEQIWCTENFEKDASHIQASAVYIDLSSLITLDLLGLLNIVKSLFPVIFFTQSVFDEILTFDNELYQPYCEHVILNYRKQDDLAEKKPLNETIIEMKNRIQRLKSFVLSGDNIQIIGTVLEQKKEISERVEDFLSNYQKVDIAEKDTMHFSYLADCQVMIESVALRAAFNFFENSPRCFGIDSLLKYLLENSLISEWKYYSSLTILIENNYKQIPVSIKHMHIIIQYEGYIILQKHYKLFRIFASQEFVFKDLAIILSCLLSLIWNDIAPSKNKKIEWSDYLFNIISLNPSMNDEWEAKILNYVGTHTKTKQNTIDFIEYTKQRMIKP